MCSLCVKAWKKENPCFLACCWRSYSSFVAITCFGVWQVCTQRLWKWPYGVGLLVCGLDESGARWNYNCPSGNYFEYQAFAIGSHSQAAKTYLERRFEKFVDSSPEDLIKYALIATRESLQGEKLRSSICTIAVVGVGEPFIYWIRKLYNNW